MRIFYSNQIDLAGVTFTPTTYDVAYPPQNLANEHRSFPWKTGTTVASENVVIDLGSAKAITSVILLDHTLTSGDTNIKLEGNSTNSWGAPAFTQALTWTSGPIAAIFGSQSLRYWRLSFTKSSAGEQRAIGRLFLGTYYTTTEGAEDMKLKPVDLSQSQMTEGGQSYSDAQGHYRAYEVNFSAIATATKDSLETFTDYTGTHTAFFFQVEETSSYAKFTEYVYGKLQKLPEWSPHGFDSTGALGWDVTLEMQEQL